MKRLIVLLGLFFSNAALAYDVTITIKDDQKDRTMNSFASAYGYNDKTDGTKAEFLKAKLVNYVEDSAASYEAKQEGTVKYKAAYDKAKTEITVS